MSSALKVDASGVGFLQMEHRAFTRSAFDLCAPDKGKELNVSRRRLYVQFRDITFWAAHRSWLATTRSHGIGAGSLGWVLARFGLLC